MQNGFVGSVAQVALAEKDAGLDLLCRRGGEVAFDPARVQVASKRCDQKESIEIGGDNLLVCLLAGELARESIDSRHECVNNRLSASAGRVECNPVTDSGKIRPLPRLVPQSAAHARPRLAVLALDVVNLALLREDTTGAQPGLGERLEL